MRIFTLLRSLCEDIPPLTVLVLAGGLLAFSFLVGAATSEKGLYAALVGTFAPICFLISLYSDKLTEADRTAFAALILSLGGALYLVLFFIVRGRKKREARREKRAEEERKTLFTLPEKENTFIRDRLGGLSLRDTKNAEEEFDAEENKLRFNHARELLKKIKAAKLTPSDRLETEELSRLITLYASKETLTNTEVRALNDCLARLLKTAAKYAV